MGEGLIFRKSGGEITTLPILDDNYPLDQNVGFVSGTSVSAAFEVKITTHGTPASYTYKWFIDGVEISNATGSTYVWTGSEKGTHYIYCQVISKAGQVTTRTATLKVDDSYPPTLNGSYPADATIEYGASGTFSVNIATAGKPASYTYQWYKDGSAINGATSSSYTVSNWSAGTYYLSCVVSNSAGSITSRSATCNVRAAQLEPNEDFTYTGSYEYVPESGNNWHLILKTSGTLTFYNRGSGKDGMDVFMVGGGAGGRSATNFAGGAGGGGGYTKQFTTTPALRTQYGASIGSGGSTNGGGGTTSIFSTSIGGGAIGVMGNTEGVSSYNATGGAGGSGGGAGGHCWKASGYITYYQPGAGGTNGGAGGNRSNQSAVKGGTGQGSSTYAFGDSSFVVFEGQSPYPFSGGGGGGRGAEMWTVGSESNTASGGNYGGGGSQKNGIENTGGGGGGGNCTSTGSGIDYGAGGAGGSGIIIIRNKR